jgi:Poly A polymerase head domain
MTTTNGIRQVQHYDNILEALQRAIPGSVHIAGGAVRDTILDRPIRDIDIFLHHTAGDPAAALLRTKFGYVKVGEWVQYEHFSDPMLVRVAKFEKADETIPLCLIGLAENLSPHDNIARFDFGVCMAEGWRRHPYDHCRLLHARHRKQNLHALSRRQSRAIQLLDGPVRKADRRPLQGMEASGPGPVRGAG